MNRKIRIAMLISLTFTLAAITLGMASPSALANPCPHPDKRADRPRLETIDDCVLLLDPSAIRRPGVITYTIASGDTMWGIAQKFGLDVDTLRYSNPELARNPDVIRPGQVLRILPFPGAIHTVKKGDTLKSIARKWRVSPEAIVRYRPNHVALGQQLMPGQELVIPGGRLDVNIPKPDLSPESTFAWPLRGWISQGYSAKHRAIDIATVWGAPVYAAGEGRVVRAGWLFTGYGFSVIIRHPNGLVTLYSHMTNPAVKVGDWVKRGQQIGLVGSTGHSTGPHVHFEVRKNHVRMNPLSYLPSLPPH